MNWCANLRPCAALIGLLIGVSIAGAQDATYPIGDAISPAFVGQFSNGVEVELIGVSESPSNANGWRAPDGSPLAVPPYQPPGGRGNMWNSPMLREVCWRWRGVDDADMQTSGSFEESTNGWGTVNPIGPDGNVIKELTACIVPFTLIKPTGTLRFTLSYPGSQWQTYHQGQGGYRMAHGRKDGSGITLDRLRMIDGGAFVVMGYKFPMNLDARLSAIDAAGRRHIGACEPAGNLNDFRMLAATFPELAPEKIRTWIVEQRLRVTETIAFRNVSLDPLTATFVQIEGPIANGVPAGMASLDDLADVEFGRIVEAVVHGGERAGEERIDFDVERIVPREEGVPEEQAFQWLQDHGVDAAGGWDMENFVVLVGYDLIAVAADADLWDRAELLAAQLRGAQPMPYAHLDASGELPATYAFQTREGARGVLKIVEIVPGQAVKIRYKLAHPKRGEK